MAGTAVFHLLSDSEAVDPAVLLGAPLKGVRASEVRLVRYPAVRTRKEIGAVYEAARKAGGIVAHALLDSGLRHAAHILSRTLNIPSIDLIGPIIERLADLLDIPPNTQPELFRHLDEDYFRRIEAIEFAVAHDDGKRPYDLAQAEIVLAGVSRTSKTPLSMYMASRGWLVANVPLVVDIAPPQELFTLDPRKVFGLVIRAERLAMLRQVRLTRLGLSAPSDYAEIDYVRQDLLHAQEVFRQGKNWTILDVTAKSIEETANEVIYLVHERTGSDHPA